MNWRRLLFWRKPPKEFDDVLAHWPEPGESPLDKLAKTLPDNARVDWFEAPLPRKEVWNGEEYHVMKSNFNPAVILDHANNIVWQEGEPIERLADDILMRISDGVRMVRTIRQGPDGCFTLKLETEVERVHVGNHIPFLDLPPITD